MRRVLRFNSIRVFCALAACLLAHAAAAETPESRSGGAAIEWSANRALSFQDGDTLEFSLRLPPSLIANAPDDALPSVGAWLTESGAQEPAADALQSGRVLVLRSARSCEWIVQARGLKAPKENVALDLLVRWSFAKADTSIISGKLKFPGRISFGSKPIDVVMLMDGSWSMEQSDPKRQRVTAVRDFIKTARSSAAIGRIGIVQFDSKSKTLIDLTPVSGDFEKAVGAINEAGMTDIDGGVRHALNLIEPDRRNGAAIVLFTDGIQEPGEYLNAHLEAQKAGVAIHTMTLGVEADRKLLKRIAEETGGSYADAEKDNDISAAYAAIVGRITRLRTITSGELGDAKNSVGVPVDPTCTALSFATVSAKPGVLKLAIPGGTNWSSGEAANPQNFIEKPTHGVWSAQWIAKAGAEGKVQVAASARTSLYPLFFKASPLPASPVEFDANDPHLAVSLFDGGEPVSNAKIEARFEYVVAIKKDEFKTERATVELFDDGQHDEGKAGDGIYAADIEKLGFLSKNDEIVKGAISVVVTGTRNGAAFRRELQSPFTVKRNAPPALLVSGAYDFGEQFAGETIVGEVNLRVRGAGGALKMRFENTPAKLVDCIRLIDAPSALKPKEKRAQRIEIKLPETVSPGDYTGIVSFEMAGVERVNVQWRVRAQTVRFNSEPSRFDFGDVFPGTIIKKKLRIATSGGTMQLAAVEAMYLTNKPFDAFTLDKAGREIEVEYTVPETAHTGDISDAFFFKDAAKREVGRVPILLHVLPVELNVEAALDFGTVESGDTLKREIVLKWAGGVVVPLVPHVTVGTSSLNPVISALTERKGGWVATFDLPIPADTPSSDSIGTIGIVAGPFKQDVRWTAKIIKPTIASDVTTLDFGRVFPGRHAERVIVFHAETARAADVDLSLTQVFHKLHVAGVTLPESALAFTKKLTFVPGSSSSVVFRVTLPDDAQDGRYDGVLRLTSRLGSRDIPLTFKSVNVVDAAAFHVTPTSVNFKITEGETLPLETVQIVSHDDEELPLVLNIPGPQSTLQPTELKPNDPIAGGSTALAPIASVFNDSKQTTPLSTLKLMLPPRGTISVTLRPRGEALDGESGTLSIDGAKEHQEVELHVQRFAALTASLIQPEPPKLLNWIIAFIILGLIAAALIAKYFIKKSGVRYVVYAAIIHLVIFSLAMPQKAIMDALPESIEVSLLDAQESLGMSLSNQQSRRLDALHSGGGVASDDKRAPVLGQATLPEKNGPVELPTPGAGPASPRPSPMNLDAARGVENPIRPADVPEAARGSVNAPQLIDAPLAFDSDKPSVVTKPAPAEKVSVEAPRAVEASSIQSVADAVPVPTNFTAAPISQSARVVVSGVVPRNAPSASIERFSEVPPKTDEVAVSGRRSATAAEDAPLNPASDAPLAFDNEPVAAPKVKPNVNATPLDTARNIPVTANESSLGSPGLGTLNAPTLPLVLSAAGTPGTKGAGAGESLVALARTDPLPFADSSAGVGSGQGGSSIGSAISDANAGTGFGREGGGLPSGGDEPLSIGTNGGDGPGARASGNGDGSAGGRGSGNGNSLIGGTQSGNGQKGSDGPGGGGFGGFARTTAAGGGGLGGDGKGFATGGTGKGSADFGLSNGNGSAWHGRPGGKGGGVSLARGSTSAQLERGTGNGAGGVKSGNGTGDASTGMKSENVNGGIPNGNGSDPGGRVRGGLGLNGDGPGGMGDKPLAVGPVGGGGIKPSGTGVASGGGDAPGHGGGGGFGMGRNGPAGGTALDGGGSGGVGLGGLGASGIGGGNGRPGGSNGKCVSVARGRGSQELEDAGGALKAKAVGVVAGPPHRGITAAYTGGLVRVSLGLAKHSGDWDSSPFALKNLRSAFIERSGLPELEVSIPTVEMSDLNAMLKCRMIMMTSNFPVVFKPAEVAAIREYVARGGTLWVNDSSASDYEKFDEAFRPQVPLLVPGSTLEKLPVEHDFFAACYDLTKGFKGFRIPPGDKYRQDYMEAAFMPEAVAPGAAPNKAATAEVVDLADADAINHRRAGIIYTRNDYADGMEIDPRMNAGMKSLTDLTNGEMLESSLRFGMNLIGYSMGPEGLKLPPPLESVAEFEKVYRYKGPALDVLDDFSVLTDAWNKPTWVAESKDFFNESVLDFVEEKPGIAKVARISCRAGEKFKAAISRFGDRDLSKDRALVFDLHSGLTQGMNVSMMFYCKDNKVFESRAVFVRPGWNRNIRFPLEMGDMKSNSSTPPWKNYDQPFDPRDKVERISVTFYNLNESGTVKIGPIREEKKK